MFVSIALSVAMAKRAESSRPAIMARKMMVKPSAGSTVAGRFDALDLAARGEALASEVDLLRRPRVADRLAPKTISAPIAWHIAGARDALGRPTLAGAAEGNLPLACPRVLHAFAAT